MGGATINVICDAYANEVVPGETWNAQIETFNSNGTLNGTALFSTMTGSQTLYDDAVYLYSELLTLSLIHISTNHRPRSADEFNAVREGWSRQRDQTHK